MRNPFAPLAWQVILTITLACVAVISPIGAAPLGPDWARQAHEKVRSPGAQELADANAKAVSTLAELRSYLATQPEGELLGERFQLGQISAQLTAEYPDAAVLRSAMRALRVKRPGPLAGYLARFRAALALWSGQATLPDAWEAEAHEQIDRLSAWNGDIGGEAELAVRAAYASLADSHRVDALLPEIRAAYAQPNQQLHIGAPYLQAIAARRFTVPIHERQRRDGATITARGAVPLVTRLTLLDDDRQATLRLFVDGSGDAALSACRKKISVSANSHVCLAGRQDYQLVSDGVRYDAPVLDLTSRTHLTGVNVNTRLGSRVAERVVTKVAAKRLPDADRQAMRAAKPEIAQRVNEECAEIAHRINTLFRGLYLLPFAAEDIDPQVAFRSSAEGVTWNATYARHDQLGALRAPPVPRTPASRLVYVMSLHESAVNHLGDQLAGAWVDEATFWMLLVEEFKLHSAEIEALPKGRLATALQLAEDAPLTVRLDEHSLDLALHLQAWNAGGATQATPATRVHVRYQLQPAADGLHLVRAGDVAIEPAGDDKLAETLELYFPARLTPRERFENAGVKRRLALKELIMDDGWLVIAAGLAEENAP